MLIILEGCDATGKTTLANLLKEVYNGTIIHCTAETPNNFDFFSEIIYASQYEHIIADRFCYGQFVYQDEEERSICYKEVMTLDNKFDNAFDSSWNALYILETKMLSHPMKLIYTYSDIDTISNRMIARGENPDKVPAIIHNYSMLWKQTLIKPIYFKT